MKVTGTRSRLAVLTIVLVVLFLVVGYIVWGSQSVTPTQIQRLLRAGMTSGQIETALGLAPGAIRLVAEGDGTYYANLNSSGLGSFFKTQCEITLSFNTSRQLEAAIWDEVVRLDDVQGHSISLAQPPGPPRVLRVFSNADMTTILVCLDNLEIRVFSLDPKSEPSLVESKSFPIYSACMNATIIDGDNFVIDEDGSTGPSRCYVFDDSGLRQVLIGPEDYCSLTYTRNRKYIVGLSYNRIFRWKSDGTAISDVRGAGGSNIFEGPDLKFVPGSANRLVGYIDVAQRDNIVETWKIIYDVDLDKKISLTRDLPLAERFTPDGLTYAKRTSNKRTLQFFSSTNGKEIGQVTLRDVDVIPQEWTCLTNTVVAIPVDNSVQFRAIPSGQPIVTLYPALMPRETKEDDWSFKWYLATPGGKYAGSEELTGHVDPSMQKDEAAVRTALNSLWRTK